MASARLALPDLAATHRLARRLAPLLRPGDVVALAGDLGAGKSELARAVIRARAGREIEVPSPTFTLVQPYSLPDLELLHADLYRLTDADELAELGLDEALERAALLVEWPERAARSLPAERLTISLSMMGDSAREALIEAPGRYRGWLAQLSP